MITTKKPDVLWVEFEEAVLELLPENSLTAAMIAEKYKVSKDAARRKMDRAIEKGWGSGTFREKGFLKRYITSPIIKIEKEVNNE